MTETAAGPMEIMELPACRSVDVGQRGGCITSRDGTLWCWPHVRPSSTATQPPEPAWSPPPGPTYEFDTAIPSELCLRREAGRVAGAGATTAVAYDYLHTCALSTDVGGESLVRCWGFNESGELSDGPMEHGVVTVPIAGAERVATGDGTCAATATDVVCWGGPAAAISDHEREACEAAARALVPRGYGHGVVDLEVMPQECRHPLRVVEGVGHVRDLAMAWTMVCAINDARDLVCWGDRPVLPPTVFAHDARDLDMNDHTGCILNGAGEIWCWGRLDQLLGIVGPADAVPVYVEERLPPGRRIAVLTSEGVQECDPYGTSDPCGPVGAASATASSPP